MSGLIAQNGAIAVLQFFTGQTPAVTPAAGSLWLCLLVGDPSSSAINGTAAVAVSDLQEDTTAGYARQAVTFYSLDSTTGGTTSNSGSITFTYTANQNVPVQWVALITGASASDNSGYLLYTWDLDAVEQVQTTQSIVIPSAGLVLSQG